MGPVSASIDVKICQEFHRLLVKIHYQGLGLPSPRDITGLCDLTDWTRVPPLPGAPWEALSSPEAPLPWPERWVALGSAAPSRPPAGPQQAPVTLDSPLPFLPPPLSCPSPSDLLDFRVSQGPRVHSSSAQEGLRPWQRVQRGAGAVGC